MAGYILRRYYTRPKTVTHPTTDRARRGLTSFTRRTPLTAVYTFLGRQEIATPLLRHHHVPKIATSHPPARLPSRGTVRVRAGLISADLCESCALLHVQYGPPRSELNSSISAGAERLSLAAPGRPAGVLAGRDRGAVMRPEGNRRQPTARCPSNSAPR